MVFDINPSAVSSSDIDDDAPGGKYGYRIGHSNGEYTIPDRVLHTQDDRKVRIITIGAGISGILMAHLIQRDCVNVEHAIYEKNGDIGGTWLENRYPGCACDVPSHAYTYAFALNADWPKFLSGSDDIYRYLLRVVDCFNLRQYMQFNSIVQRCVWDEDHWNVEIRTPSGQVQHDTCHILIGANGLLNSYKYPEEVDGLHSFSGKLLHTARWPDNYEPEQWKNERFAVLGSGASAIQIVPAMQPYAKHMDLFIRTPIWFAEIAGHSGVNHDYKPEERENLRNDTDSLLATAKSIEGGLNGILGIKAMMTSSAESKMVQKRFQERMREFIADDTIYDQLLPNFAVGCRRLTPGDPFMKAVQQPNITVHKAAVSRVSGNKVIASDGSEVEVDTIICATGFDVSYIPQYEVKGLNGVTLQEKWKKYPEGYMGLAVPDMPNYFVFQGPTFPVSNGSVMGPLQAVGTYIVQIVQKMQQEHVKSFTPNQEVADAFNQHAQTWYKGTCWAEQTCRSWYKDNETGRINAIWPGSSLHYCEMIARPRFEDYDIRYQNSHNMFAFMGLGFTQNQVEGKELSPYMTKEGLEKKFYSFEASPDEQQRVRDRGSKVHDSPERNSMLSGNGKVNGVSVNGG